MYIIPHLYVVKYFWSFEILNFQIPHFLNCDFFFKCLIGYYRFMFFTINLFLLYDPFVKMSFCNDKNFILKSL
jgi:hypothetical protein